MLDETWLYVFLVYLIGVALMAGFWLWCLRATVQAEGRLRKAQATLRERHARASHTSGKTKHAECRTGLRNPLCSELDRAR